MSEKALYVADTSEGKGERIFSSQARNAEMSGEYERRESILHIPFVLLFSPVTPPNHFSTYYAG